VAIGTRTTSRSGRRATRTELLRGSLLVVVLAGSGAWLYWSLLSSLRPLGGQRLFLVPFVMLGTWWASRQGVPVRDRRVSVALSLTEIPVLVAVAFLRPAYGLGSVFIGLLVAQVQKRRPMHKALLNSLALSFAMEVATLAYDHLLGTSHIWSLRGWLVAAGSIASATFVDYVIVLFGVIVFVNWRRRLPPMRSFMTNAYYDVAICAAGGITAFELLPNGDEYIVLFAVLVATADVYWRRVVEARQRAEEVRQLYGFVKRLTSSSGGVSDLVGEVLEGARSILATSRAMVVLPHDRPLESLARCYSLSGDGPLASVDTMPLGDLAHLVVESGGLVIKDRGPEGAALKEAHQLTEALAAPLIPDDPGSGYLLVAEREYSHQGFGPGDVALIRTLATNSAISLRRAQLADRLQGEASARQHEATHDSLTDLANRVVFADRLQAACGLEASREMVALVLLDLDDFKRVNDTLGHQAGDAILAQVARRLRRLAGEGRLVARLGGDEFVVLVEGAVGDEPGMDQAMEVLGAFSEPMTVGDLTLDVRASVGVAASVAAMTDPVALFRHAEIAMYTAKANSSGVVNYEASHDRTSLRKLTMVAHLRRAIEEGGLDVYYQPVVDLASGKALSCEALTRWAHDRLGAVAPDEFIPVAERAGLIDQLTWWVLDTALAQVKKWRASAPHMTVSVNLSPISLLWPRLTELVDEALSRAGLGPDALRFELTETTIMSELGNRALAELAELGVSLSLDDFGTGYSSLTRLRQLPFDEVKIDRSFVTDMATVSDDAAVVRSVVELARGLGKVVTAEGVEDELTARLLTEMGCHSIQGFWLAPALPPAKCEALLREAARWPLPEPAPK
jgi:diguanylate cyclase (GGDEF)-like protein